MIVSDTRALKIDCFRYKGLKDSLSVEFGFEHWDSEKTPHHQDKIAADEKVMKMQEVSESRVNKTRKTNKQTNKRTNNNYNNK